MKIANIFRNRQVFFSDVVPQADAIIGYHVNGSRPMRHFVMKLGVLFVLHLLVLSVAF